MIGTRGRRSRCEPVSPGKATELKRHQDKDREPHQRELEYEADGDEPAIPGSQLAEGLKKDADHENEERSDVGGQPASVRPSELNAVRTIGFRQARWRVADYSVPDVSAPCRIQASQNRARLRTTGVTDEEDERSAQEPECEAQQDCADKSRALMQSRRADERQRPQGQHDHDG